MARGTAHLIRSLFVLVPLALAAGCVTTRYNAQLDTDANALHGELSSFVEKMNAAQSTPEGTYETNKQFYEDVKTKLGDLSKRAEASNGADLAKHFTLIAENVESLRKLHEGRGDQGLSELLSGPALSAINTQFKSLATLQATYRGAEKQ